MNVLYVSYNGLLEPIGRSQVLGYVVAQSVTHRFVIISFERTSERQDRERVTRVADQLARAGATWIRLPYLAGKPRFISATVNLLRGTMATLRAARRHRAEVIHARSYLGALMALPARIVRGTPFLFDMRGFWPDEGVASGRWGSTSLTYRVLKHLERILLKRAGAMVTLTESGAAHLSRSFPEAGGGRPICVVPTCAHIGAFHPAEARTTGAFVFGYAGSVNDVYLFDEFLLTYLALRRRVPSARMLILNRHEHDYIRRRIDAHQIDPACFELKSVDPENIPDEMRRMTVGTILIRPFAAKVGAAPTKMAEFLATGLPCLGNTGCGDVADILERERVGVAIESFSAERIDQAVGRLLLLLEEPDLSARCRSVAVRRFSLDVACARYDALYTAMQSPAH